LWWIRRDLRLHDNTALNAALDAASEVIPVFILDDRLLNSPRVRGPRLAWMLEALRRFAADLDRYGARLIVRRGDPVKELAVLLTEAKADGVYFNRDYSPYAVRRDRQVAEALAAYTVKSFKDLVIHESHETRTGTGGPYGVYTPYRKAWVALPKPESRIGALARLRYETMLFTLPLPTAESLGTALPPAPIAEPGEAAAIHALETFIAAKIGGYKTVRDLPGEPGTAILSPYLRWGMISPRACYWAAHQANADRESITCWIGELIWREFNYQVLAENPQIVRRSYRPAYDRIVWESDPAMFESWTVGRTGFPIVDAAMRQLAATGWLHNRVRMIVASFLCKDLLIDWRRGEAYFMAKLLDGDVANNVGGWQWTAGSGTDAAPYFRIFNPVAQSQKFDPQGHYIRRWVPELRTVPVQHIHAPGLYAPPDYPAPIVDHAVQRAKALRMYAVTKSG
jgi:deoxyribodipyrimidine photo-lyase